MLTESESRLGFIHPFNANKALLTVCGSGLVARGRKHVKAPFNRVSCCSGVSGVELLRENMTAQTFGEQTEMTCYDLRSSTMCLFREKKNSQAPDGGFLLSAWRMWNAHFSGILRCPLTRQLCVRLIWPYFWDLWHFYGLSSNTVWQGLEKKKWGRGELDVDWSAPFGYRGKIMLCNRAVLTMQHSRKTVNHLYLRWY